jgi:hypothetical protein
MASKEVEFTDAEIMLVLRFWARGMEILQNLTPEQIDAVPGLREAINSASELPAAIGWDDKPVDRI